MKQIEVTILDQSYVLGCPEGGEAMLRSAVKAVDHEMTAIRNLGKVKSRERIAVLAKAKVPVALIHGDVDKVVPLKENSAELVRRYQAEGAGDLVKLIVLEGQGHNFFEGFFRSQPLVDFAIAKAKEGAKK